MAGTVVDKVIQWIMREEGGVADVGDGMGITRYGQTLGWLERWGLPAPHSHQDAYINYAHWLEHTHLDTLCDVDDMLPIVVADFAIHAGERPAIKALQEAVGVTPDGTIGPKTLEAIDQADRNAIAHLVLATRIEHGGATIRNNPQRALYAKGWAARWARQLRYLA